MSTLLVGFGGAEPFEVEGDVSELRLVWESADAPPLLGGVLRLDPVEVSFEVAPEFVAWFEELAAGLPEAREREAEAARRTWSGPDKLQRQILHAFRVVPSAIGLASWSVLSSEYRRRQRARVKRRRR